MSFEHGYLFIQVPRTASTALAKGVLEPHLGGERLPPAHVIDGEGRIVVNAKHAALADLLAHGVLDEPARRQLLVFTTVRNPFDHLVSEHLNLRLRQLELLDDPEWRRTRPTTAAMKRDATEMEFAAWATKWFERRPAARARRFAHTFFGRYYDGVDRVLRFERLQEDFDLLVRDLGVADRLEIPTINPTPADRAGHRDHYDARARRAVERAFRPIIRRFGYAF